MMVISERDFAKSFTAFWRQLIPLGDSFIRSINRQAVRTDPPLHSITAPDRRAYVNETAFRAFHHGIRGKAFDLGAMKAALPTSAQAAQQFIARLQPASVIEAPKEEELEEAEAMASRLGLFFINEIIRGQIEVDPQFVGCGRVKNCFGDVLAAETLYEVKAGDRDFLLFDLKQLLVYCALNQASKSHPISAVGIVNPRSGVYFSSRLDVIADAIAARSPQDLFTEIIEFASRDTHSR